MTRQSPGMVSHSGALSRAGRFPIRHGGDSNPAVTRCLRTTLAGQFPQPARSVFSVLSFRGLTYSISVERSYAQSSSVAAVE